MNNASAPNNDIANDGEIAGIQLSIYVPTITKTKVYDGNTTADGRTVKVVTRDV